MKNKHYEIDMIHGSILPKMVTFFLPLMFSSILQLMFNAVDLAVVGRFTGSEALAAVGSTSSLIGMIVNLFIGVSIGANIQTARCIAQRDREMVQKAGDTAIITALAAGILMMFLGSVLSRSVLRLMQTPSEILPLSDTYLRIYFLGTPFFMVYNFGAAILRASGDTRRPMYYLIIAGALNAGLNLILVIIFSLGVVGVAAATVFSQLVSCALVLRTLYRGTELYRLKFKNMRLHTASLITILRIGLPTGIQSVVINFSNVLLQSSVNSLGALAMAGHTAANNLQSFTYISCNAITQACMTFISQNYAAGQLSRVRKIIKLTFLLEFVTVGAVGICGTVFGAPLLGIFTDEAEVVEYGMQIVSLTLPLYFICGFMDCVPGILRGLGHATIPMLVSVLGTVGTRIVWVAFLFPAHRNIRFLYYSYPVSWTITVLMQLVCLAIVMRKTTEKMELSKSLS